MTVETLIKAQKLFEEKGFLEASLGAVEKMSPHRHVDVDIWLKPFVSEEVLAQVGQQAIENVKARIAELNRQIEEL